MCREQSKSRDDAPFGQECHRTKVRTTKVSHSIWVSTHTYTVSYTVTHSLKYNYIIINCLLADAADLKSADPKGLWGFKSPSRHHLTYCWLMSYRRVLSRGVYA